MHQAQVLSSSQLTVELLEGNMQSHLHLSMLHPEGSILRVLCPLCFGLIVTKPTTLSFGKLGNGTFSY